MKVRVFTICFWLLVSYMGSEVSAEPLPCNIGSRYRTFSNVTMTSEASIVDVVDMLKYILKKPVSNERLEQCGDYTDDGTIDIIDVVHFLRHIIGDDTPVASHHTGLVWSDEFHRGEWRTKWWPQTIGPNEGSWYNGEQQRYTDDEKNVYASDGTLKIRAVKVDGTYDSARLNSKFKFKYKHVQVRAKLPSSLGTWPAIWTLGANIDELGSYFQTLGYGDTSWAQCGEIDIMEQAGAASSDKVETSSAIHYNPWPSNTYQTNKISVPEAVSEFHTYSLIWTADTIQTFVDGVPVFTDYLGESKPITNTFTYGEFDHDHFILLNVAMGGTMGGVIPEDFTESTMEIDYVRVYDI